MAATTSTRSARIAVVGIHIYVYVHKLPLNALFFFQFHHHSIFNIATISIPNAQLLTSAAQCSQNQKWLLNRSELFFGIFATNFQFTEEFFSNRLWILTVLEPFPFNFTLHKCVGEGIRSNRCCIPFPIANYIFNKATENINSHKRAK